MNFCRNERVMNRRKCESKRVTDCVTRCPAAHGEQGQQFANIRKSGERLEVIDIYIEKPQEYNKD